MLAAKGEGARDNWQSWWQLSWIGESLLITQTRFGTFAVLSALEEAGNPLFAQADQNRGGAVTRVLCTRAQELTTAFGALLFQTRHFESPYLVYHEKIKTSRVFIRDCSMVSVYPLVLLGGGQVHMQLQKGEFVISLDDGWIRFVAASHQVTNRRENAGGRAVPSGISGASRSPLCFTTSARSPSWWRSCAVSWTSCCRIKSRIPAWIYACAPVALESLVWL